MPGRTLDALVQEKLGIAEMVILRLQWTIEDLQAQLVEARRAVPPVTDGPEVSSHE